jgi:hypothetical protein
VVASDEGDAIRKPDLETQQHEKRLERIKPSVNKIPKKQVICIRAFTALAEQRQKVVKLAMYISAYSDRCLYQLHITLLHQKLLGLVAQLLYKRLWDMFALAN